MSLLIRKFVKILALIHLQSSLMERKVGLISTKGTLGTAGFLLHWPVLQKITILLNELFQRAEDLVRANTVEYLDSASTGLILALGRQTIRLL